jgi:integrase
VEHAELVAPWVAHDPEVKAALLLMVIAGRAQRLQALDLGLNIVGLQVQVHPFLSRHGTYVRRSNFNRRVWQPATRAAGVEGLRVHDLRHTAGTLATAAGGSLREVMDRLGHSTTVAAVRYQHVMIDRDAAIASELDRLIRHIR